MSSSSAALPPVVSVSSAALGAFAHATKLTAIGSTNRLDLQVIIRQAVANKLEGAAMVIVFVDGDVTHERHGKSSFLPDKTPVMVNSKVKLSRVQLSDGKSSFIFPDDMDSRCHIVAMAFMPEVAPSAQAKPTSAVPAGRHPLLRSQRKVLVDDDAPIEENAYKFLTVEDQTGSDGQAGHRSDDLQGGGFGGSEDGAGEGMSQRMVDALKGFGDRFPPTKESGRCLLTDPSTWFEASKDQIGAMMKRQRDARHFKSDSSKQDFFLLEKLARSFATDIMRKNGKTI